MPKTVLTSSVCLKFLFCFGEVGEVVHSFFPYILYSLLINMSYKYVQSWGTFKQCSLLSILHIFQCTLMTGYYVES